MRVLISAAAAALMALAAGCLLAAPASANHTLTLTVTKTAGGTVTSNDTPREIDCGTDCGGTYEHDRFCEPPPDQHLCDDFYRDASLTATPARGYRFVGWSGACSGTSTCDLTMDADHSVHAEFANSPPSVTIASPTGDWLRGFFTTGATVTDDSGIAAPVRFELWQRNSFGVLVAAQPGVDAFSPGSSYQASFSLSGAYPDHAQGAQVRVRACDDAGACTVATRTYGVDRIQPVFTEVSGPPATVGPGTYVWTFRAGDATSGLAANFPWCDVPGQAGQTCGEDKEGAYEFRRTYTTSGTHTWRVSIWDNAGNARFATRSFTVDADPPETTIDSGPADGSSSTSTTAAFNFRSEPGAAFRCRIYSTTTAPAVFGDCSGPGASHTTTGLPPGTYRFEVVARDGVGNTDPTPAGRTFTVAAPATEGGNESGGTGSGGTADTGGGTPPTTTITTPPGGSTEIRTPDQQTPTTTPPPAGKKPGKCSKLKGKKRAACIKRACGKYRKSKKTAKKYRACVKTVTRRA